MDSEFQELVDMSPAHAIGLLAACGNYFVRRIDVPFDELPDPADAGTPAQRMAHRNLAEAYRRIAEASRDDVPSPEGKAVFTIQQQQELGLHKYVRGMERLTQVQLRDLVRSVREYAAVAVPLPLLGMDADSMLFVQLNRCRHAHNWIIRFAAQPFTDEEYGEDVRATVLSRKPAPN
jgi:hypothetical protein